MQKQLMASCLAVATLLGPSQAQQEPLQRKELQRLELPPDKISFLDLVTIEARSSVPTFAHPGAQLLYVLEGDLTLEIEGRPALALKPGMSVTILSGAPYRFENHGGAAKLVDFVVEKDLPSTP
ncbi:cupin domain-containing protein [Methylocapsa acidiphila]|uniref:cupin domain-containing protein n=1 Tax=Methylocapsa acidiphila TaxID=133552 RepID=UPI0018DC6DD2|nr:cupin domain-containing protein [Methylocapsa acidiphila]